VANPARETVERYFDAWTSGDFATARELLHDDLKFSGPIDSFDNADAFVETLKGLSQILVDARRRGLVADDEHVCLIYDLETGPAGVSPVAEWYEVRDGKVASLEAFFDARPFAPLFEQREGSESPSPSLSGPSYADAPRERCPSGLRSATGNRVRAERCVAGSNPALSVVTDTSGTSYRTCLFQSWMRAMSSRRRSTFCAVPASRTS
jgi:ketosteroid isomerase-like protein